MARLIFAGSPSVATPYLERLAVSHDIVAVVTRTDAAIGRKRIVTPTPVAQLADRLGLNVIKTNSLRGVTLPDSDAGVVVAYGGMVPSAALSQPRFGWLNAHFSLLPTLRGAAPVQRGLWNGDAETGLTVFSLVEELDAGPIIYQRPIPFIEMETASEALTRISRETADEVNQVVNRFVAGEVVSHEQSGPVTFAPKFQREDGRIDWNADASTVVNRIRAVTNEPGAFAFHGENQIAVLRVGICDDIHLEPGVVSVNEKRVCVGTATSAIELVTVKPAGKSEMSGPDWARGLHATTRLT
jgi:methionyl-tRNA formyltransferase